MIRQTSLHDGPLPAAALTPSILIAAEHGAVASFVGVVRNHAHERVVVGLAYDCYRPMAERVLAQLLDEVAATFDADLSASITHGLGAMLPGDASVAIHVASAHRVAAFAACRHLIERLKQDLPVWKRERYADGSEAWLKGS